MFVNLVQPIKPMMKTLLLVITIISFISLPVFAESEGVGNGITDTQHNSASQSREDPEHEVEIYPNPLTGGRLSVNCDDPVKSIQVLNITGKIVFNEEYLTGTYSAVLDLNNLEKGLYLVRINFNDKTVHTEKVMVK